MGTSALFFGLWFINCSRLAGAFGVTKKAMADRLGVGGPPLFLPRSDLARPSRNRAGIGFYRRPQRKQRNDFPADCADKRGLDPTQSATICEISGDIRIGIPQCRCGIWRSRIRGTGFPRRRCANLRQGKELIPRARRWRLINANPEQCS